jgi:hypothetical protein
MPPLAPTDLTLTAKGAKFGAATLGWTHAGTTKYEVLAKRPWDSDWQSLHIAAAAHFGAGPYAMEVPLTDEIEFAVRAINAAGEASPKSDALASTLKVEGTWLLPWANHEIDDDAWAWIASESPETSHERDGTVLTVPSREDEISSSTGIVHLATGEISGPIWTRHGVSGNAWRRRLTSLVKNQKSYQWVWLASPDDLYKCELIGPVTRKPTVISTGAAYEYSVGFREIR